MNIAVSKTVTDNAHIAEQVSEMCFGMRVRQLSRAVTRIYDDALRPFGITSSQFILLTQLAKQDGTTAVKIGATLDIEKSTLSRNLLRLVRIELLAQDPPAGRRGRGLHLTPKGELMIEQAYPKWIIAQAEVMKVMGAGSRAALDELLKRAENLPA